jgi:hypothetical protein
MDSLASSGYRRARRALLASALGVTSCALIGAGSATAALITIGSPLTASFTSHTFGEA